MITREEVRSMRIKDISERNQWFDALSKEDKRHAIAYDVLDQLETKRYRPMTGYFSVELAGMKSRIGSYFKKLFSQREVSGKDKVELQGVLENVTCNVCAIGAVFASRVSLGNDCAMQVEKYYDTSYVDGSWTYDFSNNDLIFPGFEKPLLVKKLKGIFTNKELNIMEVVFEGDLCHWDYDTLVDYPDEFEDTIKVVKHKYSKQKQRMIWIMHLILTYPKITFGVIDDAIKLSPEYA